VINIGVIFFCNSVTAIVIHCVWRNKVYSTLLCLTLRYFHWKCWSVHKSN